MKLKPLLGTIGLIAFVIIPYLYASDADIERLSSEPKTFREIVAEYDATQAEAFRRGK